MEGRSNLLGMGKSPGATDHQEAFSLSSSTDQLCKLGQVTEPFWALTPPPIQQKSWLDVFTDPFVCQSSVIPSENRFKLTLPLGFLVGLGVPSFSFKPFWCKKFGLGQELSEKLKKKKIKDCLHNKYTFIHFWLENQSRYQTASVSLTVRHMPHAESQHALQLVDDW